MDGVEHACTKHEGNKTDDDPQGWNEKKFKYAIEHILAKIKQERMLTEVQP